MTQKNGKISRCHNTGTRHGFPGRASKWPQSYCWRDPLLSNHSPPSSIHLLQRRKVLKMTLSSRWEDTISRQMNEQQWQQQPSVSGLVLFMSYSFQCLIHCLSVQSYSAKVQLNSSQALLPLDPLAALPADLSATRSLRSTLKTTTTTGFCCQKDGSVNVKWFLWAEEASVLSNPHNIF